MVARTFNIPGSSMANNGVSLDIKTVTADGADIHVIPASGTIGGLPAITFPDTGCNLFLRSNGTHEDWIIRCLCCYTPTPLMTVSDSVYLDGFADRYVANSLSVANSPLLSFSIWIQPVQSTVSFETTFLAIDSTGNAAGEIAWDQGVGSIAIGISSADLSQFINMTQMKMPVDNKFHNMLFCIDTSSAPSVLYIYIDDAQVGNATIFFVPNGPYDLQAGSNGLALPDFFGPPGQQDFPGGKGRACIGDFWWAPTQFLDFTQTSNRRKFYSTTSTSPTTPPSVFMNNNDLFRGSGSFANGILTATSLVCSFWVDSTSDGPSGNNFFGPPTSFGYTGGNVSCTLSDGIGGTFAFHFPYTAAGPPVLTNIRFAVDLNHGIGSKVVLAYVGTSSASVTIDSDTAPNISAKFNDPGGIYFSNRTGPIADIWFAPGQFFDPGPQFVNGSGNWVNIGANGQIPSGTAPSVYFRVPANGTLGDFMDNAGTGGTFIPDGQMDFNGTVTLTPVPAASLGANGQVPTGTAPAVFMTGGKSTFGTNNGTGGAFTLTGVVEDCLEGLHSTLTPATTRSGVTFNGDNQQLVLSDGVNAVATRTDSPVGLVSVWLRLTSIPFTTCIFAGIAPFGAHHIIDISLNASGRIVATFTASDLTTTATYTQTSGAFPTDGNWHHLILAWNTQSGVMQIVVDRISETVSRSGSVGFDVGLTAAPGGIRVAWYLLSGSIAASPPVGNSLIGDAAEAWGDIQSTLDLSVSSNLDKFELNGATVSLGSDGSTPTGSKPFFYLSQQPQGYQAITFYINRASDDTVLGGFEVVAGSGGTNTLPVPAPAPFP